MKCFATTMGLTLALGAAATASGAIVYTDAGVSTVEWLDGGTWNSNSAWQVAGNTAPNNDNLWGERITGPGANGNGNNAFQSVHGEDSPALRMVVTGLDASAVYQFYVYNIAAGGAAIIQGAVSNDTAAGASLPGLASLTGGIEVLDDGTPGSSPSGDSRHRQTIAGTVTGSTSYAVYFNDFIVADGAVGDRATLDGIGYEVVPEPSSLALLGLGGLLVARRRRG